MLDDPLRLCDEALTALEQLADELGIELKNDRRKVDFIWGTGTVKVSTKYITEGD